VHLPAQPRAVNLGFLRRHAEHGGRLPQGLAACSTFGELSAKYPQAPAHILDQAKGERKKAGC
jgi:TolA-binding protein